MHQKPTNAQLENRFKHHVPFGDQGERYSAIRKACLGLAVFIRDNTPVSPEQTRAINAVDEAMMLANAAIARNEPRNGRDEMPVAPPAVTPPAPEEYDYIDVIGNG